MLTDHPFLPPPFLPLKQVQTFEGTAQVLEPQLARFILRLAAASSAKQQGGGGGGKKKTAGAAAAGAAAAAATKPSFALSSDFDYVPLAAGKAFGQCSAKEARDLLDPLLQIEAYEARVCAILLLAAEAVGEDAKEGGEGGMAEAMMKNGVLLGRLSRAHCQLVLLKKFHEAVAQQEERLAGGGGGKEGGKEGEEEEEGGVVTVGPAEVRVLRELCHLFALSGMEREMADFRARDYLSSRQAEMVGREVGRLNRVVRVEAVSLVDAWMMSDKLLGSALGRRDGRVYGALFEEALRSPLNEREVSEAYELHWKRLLLAGGGGGAARL